MAAKRSRRVTLSVSQENSEFIHAYGGARHSDGIRYNFSELVDEYLDQFRASHSPESMALSLLKAREECERQKREIEEKAARVLGTTLDDWMTTHEEDFRAHQKDLRRATKEKEQEKELFLRKANEEYQKVRQGTMPSERSDLEWFTGRYRFELKKYGISPEELVREVRKDRESSMYA